MRPAPRACCSQSSHERREYISFFLRSFPRSAQSRELSQASKDFSISEKSGPNIRAKNPRNAGAGHAVGTLLYRKYRQTYVFGRTRYGVHVAGAATMQASASAAYRHAQAF